MTSAPASRSLGTAAFTASASSPNVSPATPLGVTSDGVSCSTTPTNPTGRATDLLDQRAGENRLAATVGHVGGEVGEVSARKGRLAAGASVRQPPRWSRRSSSSPSSNSWFPTLETSSPSTSIRAMRRLIVRQGRGQRARPDEVSGSDHQGRIRLLGAESGDVRRQPGPSAGRDCAVREPDGARRRLEVAVEVVEGQELDVNRCGAAWGAGVGRLPAQAARTRSSERRCMDHPACTNPARVPSPQRRSHTPSPALTAWLLKRLHPAPGEGKVGGHLEVEAKKGHVEDLSGRHRPGETRPRRLSTWTGNERARRGGRWDRQACRPGPRTCAGACTPCRWRRARCGARGRARPSGDEVAADEIDRGLEAVVDAVGAALTVAGGGT